MSLAPSRDLVRPSPSSKAALAALKFKAERRSKAANWELARPRRVSTPALLALAICSLVTYMVVLQERSVTGTSLAIGADMAYASIIYIALQQSRFYP